MKKVSNFLKILNSVLSALCIVLATASYAFANNAPGPLAALSILSLVILILALTFAGGGSVVLARLQIVKYPSKTKRVLMNILEFVAGVILFFVGIMTTVIGIVGFSIYAIARGFKMIQWSRKVEKEGTRLAQLEGVSPKRLRIAGSTLIVLTLLVFGYSMANLDEVAGIGEWRKRAYVKILNADAMKGKDAVDRYLRENPKSGMVTCEDLVKAGFITQTRDILCFSDMTTASGSIRMTGPDRWKLKKPIAVITRSGELIPAEQ